MAKNKNNSKALITIGKILSSHGVKGFSKIFLLTDFPERYEELEKVFITKEGKPPVETDIEEIKYNHDTLLIKFSLFSSPEEVTSFKGALIQIPEEEIFELPEEFFYIDKLIGCKAYTKSDEYLGEVTDVFEGANTVISLITPNKKEVNHYSYSWSVR